jgi:predicted ABC-type transport system involved in lysophospholipase L1 biosynthesis ATPase subunit
LGDLLMELNKEEGTAMVVVTHSPALAQRMRKILVLENGRLENGKTKRTVS